LSKSGQSEASKLVFFSESGWMTNSSPLDFFDFFSDIRVSTKKWEGFLPRKNARVLDPKEANCYCFALLNLSLLF
jgi:hypothetical protein